MKMKYSTTKVTLILVPNMKGPGHRSASVPQQITVPYDGVLLYLLVIVSESDILVLFSKQYPEMKIEDRFRKNLFIVTEFINSHCA